MCCIAEVVELMSLTHITQDTPLSLVKSHVSTDTGLDRQKYRSIVSCSEDDFQGSEPEGFTL